MGDASAFFSQRAKLGHGLWVVYVVKKWRQFGNGDRLQNPYSGRISLDISHRQMFMDSLRNPFGVLGTEPVVPLIRFAFETALWWPVA